MEIKEEKWSATHLEAKTDGDLPGAIVALINEARKRKWDISHITVCLDDDYEGVIEVWHTDVDIEEVKHLTQ